MPSRIEIPQGTRFGRLTVVSEAEPIPRFPHRGVWRRFYLECECGGEKTTRLNDLRSGVVNSCGCLVRETSATIGREQTKHGARANGREVSEYKSWRGMIFRCTNSSAKGWKYYGGRGITVCNEWRTDYLEFFKHVGRKPTPAHTIDRINNNGNYEPGNVRWATKSEQAFNRRKKGTA